MGAQVGVGDVTGPCGEHPGPGTAVLRSGGRQPLQDTGGCAGRGGLRPAAREGLLLGLGTRRAGGGGGLSAQLTEPQGEHRGKGRAEVGRPPSAPGPHPPGLPVANPSLPASLSLVSTGSQATAATVVTTNALDLPSPWFSLG